MSHFLNTGSMPTRRGALGRIAAASLAAGVPGLHAQQPAATADWPKKPIQMLVGFPPGGLNDLAARALSQSMGKTLGTTFIVVPLQGAGGVIALQKLLQAPADGYTLLYTPSPTLLARPYQMSLRISHRDLTPIANVATSYPTISVKKAHRWQSFKDFQAEALANPGKIAYSTPGVGGLPHIAMENVAAQLGMKLNHVPFQGMPQATLAALSDQLDIAVGDMPHPDLRPLAVTGDERVPFWPGVPAMRELGVSSTMVARFSVVGPKGLPDAIVKAAATACQASLTDPIFQKYMRDNLLQPTYWGPAELAASWNAEEPLYRGLIDRLDLKGK
ncbi:tripartite tricarboxylate transporter substrate binding protein [Limnohabitans sp. Rim8]|uniref:Bug family tripartite tricarboxylate transporter substrate binding protein n=1 Tax=Limnohabitans sp. Rim8 TaxID=1100718 RepID=UPI003305C200